MTAHIVWDWAADCSRLVVLRRQRSCLKNCCATDWQRVFECRQNAVVWHGRRRRADSRRPGNPGRCRTRTGGRESLSWTRRAAAHEASAAGGAGARYEVFAATCPHRRLYIRQWYFSNGNGNNWPGVNGNGNDAHLRNGNNIKTEIMTSKTYRNGNVCNENGKKRIWCAVAVSTKLNESL